ncbi:MAG: ATP-binding protein [Lachnospiraceae bacterium]|nr:ATP-binding protein [Lachnospiraceae bacterium]
MKKRSPALKILYIAFIVLVVLSFTFILMGIGNRTADYSFNDELIYSWGNEWMVSVDKGEKQEVNLPVDLDCEHGADVRITKMIPANLDKCNSLMIESKRQEMLVFVNGVFRKSYTDQGQRLGNSMPYAYVFIPLYSGDEGREVEIRIESDTYYSGNISNVYLGSEMSIILMLLKKNIGWLALIGVIFIIGLIALICYIIYRKTFEGNILFLYLFWFSFFAAMWCFTQIKIRQVFIGDIALLESVGHCCFMLIPIPVILLIDGTVKSRRGIVAQVELATSMVLFLVQNILHTGFGYDYFEIQPITQIFFLIVLLLAVVLLTLDYKKEKFEGAFWLIFGLVGYTAGILGEAVCINLNVDYTIGCFYILGAVVFLLANLFSIFISVRSEQQKKKDAEDANRAKSRFLATMSHEIRTPINVVLGMNEMIIRESEEVGIKEYAINIAEAGKSLLSLVNDILDFSKIESGKMEILDVDYRIKTVLSDLIMMVNGRIGKKNVKLITDIDETIPSKYFGDEIRIKQIVTNLLTNAAKYTQEGSITFSVQNEGIEGDIIKLRFSVKDTGMGIKEEDIEVLQSSEFVRFDQKKNRSIEGTGLGLSITRQLLELMGSKLEITSTYGEGSEFYFVIEQKIIDKTPMGALDEKKTVEKRAMNTFTAKGARILAVDDTKINLTVIRGLLKPYNMEVEIATSGKRCLELCENNHYDLILMDHMMPEMDGIETLKRIRSGNTSNKTTHAIALTANAVSGAEQMYRGNGFEGYVTKPIDPVELDLNMKKHLPEKFIVPV